MTTAPPASLLDIHAAPQRLAGPQRVLAQTWALTVDAYRQLQSRKLFWITLILSTLVAASFSLVGINPQGLKILWFDELAGEVFNSTIMSPAAFYKLIFLNMGVGIWLAWAAIILALITTAGMIPELISDGSIDLYLSKPLGRVRLFLTKYVLGLLFVALQTICFCTAAFLVIGFRGGVWEPGLYWAVPLVTLMYSFLFSIAAIVGLFTGSTVAAILVTMLVWLLVIFSADAADLGVLQGLQAQEVRLQHARRAEQSTQTLLARFESFSEEERENHTGYQTAVQGLEATRSEIEAAEESVRKWRKAHRIVLAIKAPLPKTGETMAVLQRKLIDSAELEAWRTEMEQIQSDQAVENARRRNRDEEEARKRVAQSTEAAQTAEERYLHRSAWWSIGTSLGFETVLLAIACWHFARRDF